MRVLKGHGTENDFVLIPDLAGSLELSPELVRALCDRHAGLGADGVLRIVRTENAADVAHLAERAPFFMDYRNADGSIAQMCGNGVRVFLRYLQRVSLVEHDAVVATRGGTKRVRSIDGAEIAVDMGQPQILADRPVATAAPLPARAGTALLMPNPHVVVAVDSPAELRQLDLTGPPQVSPPSPEGQNVEYVYRSGPRELTMRVHERGVGETRSCGTGICAAVVAAATATGEGADGVPWLVRVPGGCCQVTWRPDGELVLSGPAIIVAEIDVDEAWLRSAAPAARVG
jgi:diaminopimelate epimerase